MRIMRAAALMAAALAMTATTLSAAQVATADDFSVTANGVASGGTLSNLPSSSTVSLAVNNLPANVGLYAFHCLVPPPGASRVPTRCDDAMNSLINILAKPTAQTLTAPIAVNAQFVGKNPNPQTGDTGTTSVDCRKDTCAIYTLGAGRDSANPAYVTFFPTVFAAVGPRMKDSAVVTLDNRVVRPGRERTIRYGEAVPFSVTLTSGLTPSLASKKCDVRNGEIRALTRNGACAVQITSSGNEQYRPFRATVTFKIRK
jgi:hypothetical protein